MGWPAACGEAITAAAAKANGERSDFNGSIPPGARLSARLASG